MRYLLGAKTNHVASGFALAIVLAFFLGATRQASAQADLNIQSRVQQFIVPLFGIADLQQFNGSNFGACFDDASLILYLTQRGVLQLPKRLPNGEQVPNGGPTLVAFFKKRENLQFAADIVYDFFKQHPHELDSLPEAHSLVEAARRSRALAPYPTPFCGSGPVAKLSVPFSPAYQTNTLQSSSSNNSSPSLSEGFGGTFQIVGPAPIGAPSFDVIGLSTQSQSVRYNTFSSKSFDAFINQGAYQHFLDAFGYLSDNQFGGQITPHTAPQNIPPANLITVDSVAFGFIQQATFAPGFRAESADLLTPQITLNRQNQDLSLNGTSCWAEVLDPRQKGFCYYTDLSLTVGQTFADVRPLENANVAITAAPGLRIPFTYWKLAFPISATGRAFEYVPGGRDDILLQIGPALTFSPPTFFDRYGSAYSTTFSVSATYNQNYSTLSAAAWHGLVIMPTLSIAFLPAKI